MAEVLKYRVYWRKFSGYKGNKMGIKDNTGSWTYGNWDLYKIGHEQVGKDRVVENTNRETVARWVDLWIKIDLLDYVDFEVTKEQIVIIENEAAKVMGKKDFWMEETPSGIKEFMIATREREEVGKKLFEDLRKWSNVEKNEN